MALAGTLSNQVSICHTSYWLCKLVLSFDTTRPKLCLPVQACDFESDNVTHHQRLFLLVYSSIVQLSKGKLEGSISVGHDDYGPHSLQSLLWCFFSSILFVSHPHVAHCSQCGSHHFLLPFIIEIDHCA